MGALRQRWDIENDRPLYDRPSEADLYVRRLQAESVPVPAYRAKLVKLAHGQSEISITPANEQHIIALRMGFNPLLDCPRREVTPEQREKKDIENRERAAKRARQNVRYLAKSLFADHMLTFSYRENVDDRARVAADWKEFVRLFRIRYPDWKYVAVLEKQERGALHIHVAVHGRQDIRWLLRCWLLAIGQPAVDVSAWLVGGESLGGRSLGAVNVEPPKRRWAGSARHWKGDKLAAYLTKYIGKEFEEAEKSTKKYWASRNIERPEIKRFWLRAESYVDAVVEAHDLIYYSGATSLSMWGDFDAGVIWICGETRRELIGKIKQVEPDFDLLGD